MPSGPKRRKAAKKRKGKEQNVQSSTNSQAVGNDDPRSHDEKESDSGDGGSPTASQGSHHESVEKAEEEENKNDSISSVGSIATATEISAKTDEQVMGESQSGSEEKGFVTDSKRNEAKEEVVVAVTEGGGSESRVIDIEFVESVKSSSSDTSSDEESQMADMKDPEPPEKDESRKSDESVGVVDRTSAVESIEVAAAQDERNQGSDRQIVTSPDDVSQVMEVASGGNSSVIDSQLKDTEEDIKEKQLAPVDNNGDNHSKESETLRSIDNQVHELELDKTAKESEALKSLDNQQRQLAVVPPTVQPTSWKSCCGLFDILMGSSR